MQMHAMQIDGDAAILQTCPPVLQVVGRTPTRENGDICGEYHLVGIRWGRAAYQKRGSSMAIRYFVPLQRWVIDRDGLQDSDCCVAWAQETMLNQPHPGDARLMWYVWENVSGSHVQDLEVLCVNAPKVVSLVGRAPGKTHHEACGEYEMWQVVHGQPLYMHRNRKYCIRYYADESRWLLSLPNSQNNIALAYADAKCDPPVELGSGCLEWQVWEQQQSFLHDPATRTLSAPDVIHVLGRSGLAENARINGTYSLAGMHDSMPFYVKPGTISNIRFSAKLNLWLIDCDGPSEPGLGTRIAQFIFTGDASASKERCTAYAEAGTTASFESWCAALQWKVWDSKVGRHIDDHNVCVTSAPLMVCVQGRDANRTNADVVGKYTMLGGDCGYPMYRKVNSLMTLRFYAPWCRWVLDREGLSNSDSCVAWVDGGHAHHPALATGEWQVFEMSRGCFLPDADIRVSIPKDAPRVLSCPEPAASVPASVGVKRQHEATKGSGHANGRWFGLFGG